MTRTDQLRLVAGQRVLLAVPMGKGARWVEARATRWSEDLFWLQCPGDPALLDAVSEGPVVLQVRRAMDALYRLKAEVLAADRSLPGLLVRPTEIVRVQRRKFFRVDVPIDPINATLEARDGAEWTMRFHIFNLSAGGVGARVARARGAPKDPPVELDRRIRMAVELPEQPGPLILGARIVRIDTDLAHSDFFGELGAEFIDATPADRERLIQWTLKLQALHIRRGLI